MEKVIIVKSSEVKVGTKGEYLQVTDQDDKKQNIFDQSLWNLFGDNLAVKLSLEKQGNWWNVTGAEAASLPTANNGEEKPSKPAPQEQGMCWKEVGNRIGDGSIERDYPNSFVDIKSQYYTYIFKTTGITLKKKETKTE